MSTLVYPTNRNATHPSGNLASDDKPSSFLANPWVYFGATFAWTWGFWGVALLLKVSVETPLGLVLPLLGALGPLVTGIGFTYLTKNSAGQRDYWPRVIDLRRIGLKWFLLLLFFVPVLNGIVCCVVVRRGCGRTGQPQTDRTPTALSVNAWGKQ